MWFIILASVVIFLLYSLAKKSYTYWKNKGIPYVKPVLFFGNLAPNLFRRKTLVDLIQDWYYLYPNKRFVGVYQFFSPTLLIRDPELIKRITVKDFDVFPDHRAFVSEETDPLFAKNLSAIKGGERWQDMRATLSPSFTSSKMRMMFGLMKNCAKQFTDYYQKQGGTITIEMRDAFTRYANDVIATTAFGVTCNSLENKENEFYLMGKDATDFTGLKGLKFFMNTFSPTLMKFLKIGIFSNATSTFFRKLIKETLKIREEKGIVRPDMIHLLMEAKKGRLKQETSDIADSGFAVVQESEFGKSKKRQKFEITDEDITAQALVFFLAGFDGTATLMSFVAYELALNFDVQKKLQNEVDSALEDCKGELTYEALLGMKYLDMVITETLRKWPAGPAGDRVSVKPFTIEPELPGEKPITLDAGTHIWYPIYSLHMDPKYFPDPLKFDPERFSEENKHKINPFTYLPFGAGPRNCIGSRFALLETKLVIAEILSKFEILVVKETQIPIQLDKTSFGFRAKNGTWLGLKPRP